MRVPGLCLVVALLALGACGRSHSTEQDLLGVWTGVWRLDDDATGPEWEFAMSVDLRAGGDCVVSFPLVGNVPSDVREQQGTPSLDAKWALSSDGVVTITSPPFGDDVASNLRVVAHGFEHEITVRFTLSDGALVRRGESRTGRPGAWRLVRKP